MSPFGRRVSDVVNGVGTAQFTRADWVRLALAALDQADVYAWALSEAYVKRDRDGGVDGVLRELGVVDDDGGEAALIARNLHALRALTAVDGASAESLDAYTRDLADLEKLGLVARGKPWIGGVLWTITDAGRAAVKVAS